MTTFWYRWMIIWCWCVIGFGAVLALSIFEALSAPTMLLLDLVFWPIDGEPAALSREAIFAVALAGALTMGLGAMILGLARDETLNGSPRLWRHVTAAVLVWYVVDSAVSILGGAIVNAVSNTVLLVTFLLPVLGSGVLGSGVLGGRDPANELR